MMLPADSIRGRIRNWIEKHSDKLGTDVLEIGSRIHNPGAWFLNNRYLSRGQWTGIDMQPGPGVDLVCDASTMPPAWSGRFTGVLCSEVLEHVERPWLALPEMRRVLKPGGWIIITVPFCFHRHAYPNDYYRYTGDGLGVLLGDAGFTDYTYQYGGSEVLKVKDHNETIVTTTMETQLFAIARRPTC